MANEPALNRELKDVKQQTTDNGQQTTDYDEGLHERFVRWMESSRAGLAKVARMINRNTSQLSHYINIRQKKYPGDVTTLENDIASLLRREEDLEFVTRPAAFCKTRPSILIWEVLQYCDEHQKMGVALAPSGTGKSETVNEYKRQNRQTILVTANITTCTKGPVIRMIADKTGGRPRKNTIADTLNAIIERLKDSRRLIIVDDAHFLNWEAFEAVRKIHDCAKIGVVYAGQERLYDQMKGKTNTAYLFDQIYSRIAIKRDHFRVEKKDVAMIVDSVWPGMDKEAVEYISQKARGKGRLRVAVDLLELAIEIAKNQGRAVDLEVLGQADQFLMS